MRVHVRRLSLVHATYGSRRRRLPESPENLRKDAESFEKGVVSEQKRDEAKAAYEAAKAGESAAKSQYELALSGAQHEDKQASSAMVTVAQGGVKEVDAILEDQYLTAPYDGEITVIYPNVSELIATGAPVMTLEKMIIGLFSMCARLCLRI